MQNEANIYIATPKKPLSKNIFYRKTSLNSYPPRKFDHGFVLKTPEKFILKPGESRKNDLQLMVKLPPQHMGQIISPPLESNLLVKPLTLTDRLSKLKIEVSNSTFKTLECRRGKSIAFLICIKCEEISGLLSCITKCEEISGCIEMK